MTLASAAEVDGAGKTVVVVADVDPDGPAAQKMLPPSGGSMPKSNFLVGATLGRRELHACTQGRARE